MTSEENYRGKIKSELSFYRVLLNAIRDGQYADAENMLSYMMVDTQREAYAIGMTRKEISDAEATAKRGIKEYLAAYSEHSVFAIEDLLRRARESRLSEGDESEPQS